MRRAIRDRSPSSKVSKIDPEIDFYPEVAAVNPCAKNIVKWGFDIHPQVTFVARRFPVACFIVWTLFFPESGQRCPSAPFSTSLIEGGWLYIISSNVLSRARRSTLR